MKGKPTSHFYNWMRSLSAKVRNEWADFVMTYSLSRSIRINRISRGWTQEELGIKCGMAQPAIARLETWRGCRRCRVETLVRIASAFDCALQVGFVEWGEWVRLYINPDGSIREPIVTPTISEDAAFLGSASV